jgi:hypothetical protein
MKEIKYLEGIRILDFTRGIFNAISVDKKKRFKPMRNLLKPFGVKPEFF